MEVQGSHMKWLPFLMGGDGIDKRQKEVFLYQLDREEAVLGDLARQYKKALEDIEERIKMLQSGEMTQSKAYQIDFQKRIKEQVEAVIEKLHGDE